jgi:hypothetical protein
MDIIDLLDSQLLALPRNRDCTDFGAFLNLWFAEFLSEIGKLDGSNWVTTELKRQKATLQELCKNIELAVGSYLLGFPHRAYDHLKEALNQIKSSIKQLASLPNVVHHLQYLYRIRLGSLTDFERPDLFHLPFEKRHLVKPQRYSISGLPSLYLGGSSWVCWEELSRPPFESIQISRFRAAPASTVRVLDFGWRPAVIAAFMDRNSAIMERSGPSAEFALASAICWPLLASCSIRVMYPNSPFTPEYVVPQLLLQWLRNESDIDGIRYFSTRIAQYVDSPEPASNYVFPVRTNKATGFCTDLSEKFLLSRPMAWSLVDQLPILSSPPSGGVPQWRLGVNPDVEIAYWKTHFFDCEAKINSLPCANVMER